MGEWTPGRLFGLSFTATPAAALGSLLLWAVLTLVGWNLLDWPPLTALMGGLLATGLHWAVGLVHHLGHALAARRTGYPMEGVRLGQFLVMATSLYPPDEGPLPPAVHLRRALGGPLASVSFGLLAWLLSLLLRPIGGLLYGLAVFVALDSLLVYGLGVFLPLSFTDGGTLLRYGVFRPAGEDSGGNRHE